MVAVAVAVMAIRTRVVAAVVATGEASSIVRAVAGMLNVVTIKAVMAMNLEPVEVTEEAEAAWAEVIVVALINLVVLAIKDLIMILNRIIQTTIPSSCKA